MIDPIISWTYPKSNIVSKKAKSAIKKLITACFSDLGYTCKFESGDE